MFAVGLWLYLQATKARDRIGSIGLWSLVVFLVATYLSAIFGPPPPSPTALAIGGHALWLVVAWAYWVDVHRAPTVPGGAYSA
jgi:uncharacterized membrane protein YdjX (TVP38/TMEM64 family)